MIPGWCIERIISLHNLKLNMKLIEIKGIFDMDAGAPSPLLVAGESYLKVLFYTDNEPYCCALEFVKVMHHKFGIPGNETINGHPYYQLGLGPYGFFELVGSDYIKFYKAISEVHERFDAARWESYRHFIVTFHDTMFECIATDYEVHNIPLELYNQISSAGVGLAGGK